MRPIRGPARRNDLAVTSNPEAPPLNNQPMRTVCDEETQTGCAGSGYSQEDQRHAESHRILHEGRCEGFE